MNKVFILIDTPKSKLESKIKHKTREIEYNLKKRDEINKDLKKIRKELKSGEQELEKLIDDIKNNRIDPKKCKHDPDWSCNSGLGYSGELCSLCSSLLTSNEDVYMPTHPYKLDCEHEDYIHTKELQKEKFRPLNRYGRWCKICGHCWQVEG
jgi:hypothetical protein